MSGGRKGGRERRAIFSNLLQIGSTMPPKKQRFLARDAADAKYLGPVIKPQPGPCP